MKLQLAQLVCHCPPSELGGIDAFSATYAVTPSMLLSANSQFFFVVALGWRWLGVAYFLASGTICLLQDYPTISVIAFSVAALMTAMWIKAYFQYRSIALSRAQISGNMQVTIELTESGIKGSSVRGTACYTWNEVNRLKASRDFVFIMRDKLPLMSLPKSQFSSEAIAFLYSRVASCQKETKQPIG